MQARITTALFCALLAALALGNLLTPTRVFSEQENRYLAQLPAFSLSSLRSGKYTRELDAFVTDQFVGRDRWVGAKTFGELLLQKGASNGVYFGEDHYLIEMFDTLDEEQYGKNIGYLRDFSRLMGEQGVGVDILLAPTASAVLSDKLPRWTPEVDQGELLAGAGEVLPNLTDVLPALTTHRLEDLYYRTDHHWTSLGAYRAYSAWREARGEAPVPLRDFRQEPLSGEFYGTTYTKASLYAVPPDTITAFLHPRAGDICVDYGDGSELRDSLYELSHLEGKDKYAVFLNANQPQVRISTGVDNGRKLLLVKDSYANAFVQMLLGDYEEIIVVDLRFFRSPVAEFAAQNGVTEALVLYNLKGFSTDLNLFYLTQ